MNARPSGAACFSAEQWFASRAWIPHAFQREAWRRFHDGESGLIHVPTGSGKTYAAYLAALEEVAATNPREGLRHLAPVGILDTDEEHSLGHVHAGDSGEQRPAQQPAGRDHRQATTATAAPTNGAVR